MIDLETANTFLSYDEFTGEIRWKKSQGKAKIGEVAGQISGWGYIRIPLNNKKYSAHRIAWLMFYGRNPVGQIDHIDSVKTNNAISNLREATPSLNQLYNKRPTSANKVGFRGVRRMREKFAAQLKLGGKMKHLGSFDSPELAHEAYLLAKNKAIEAAHNIGVKP